MPVTSRMLPALLLASGCLKAPTALDVHVEAEAGREVRDLTIAVTPVGSDPIMVMVPESDGKAALPGSFFVKLLDRQVEVSLTATGHDLAGQPVGASDIVEARIGQVTRATLVVRLQTPVDLLSPIVDLTMPTDMATSDLPDLLAAEVIDLAAPDPIDLAARDLTAQDLRAPTCYDHRQNGNETGLDCGGSCPPCPIAFYTLDNCSSSSSTIVDDSGNGHNGVRTGEATCGTGKIGQGLLFTPSSIPDGGSYYDVGGQLTVNDAPVFHFGTAFTLAAWISPRIFKGSAGWIGDQMIVGKLYTPDAFNFRVTGDGKAVCSVSLASDGGQVGVSVSSPVSIGRWTHVAAVYSGSALKLYVDGIVVDQRAASGPVVDSDRAIGIGDHPAWAYFDGSIDEVRLYDVALSDADIDTIAKTP